MRSSRSTVNFTAPLASFAAIALGWSYPLILRPGSAVVWNGASDLTEKLYEQDYERDSNVIEVLIARLRRKLDPGDTLHPIETLRGRGYRLALPRGG